MNIYQKYFLLSGHITAIMHAAQIIPNKILRSSSRFITKCLGIRRREIKQLI